MTILDSGLLFGPPCMLGLIFDVISYCVLSCKS